MSLAGEMRKLVRRKKKEGWEVEKTKKGHLRWIFAATGAIVISAHAIRSSFAPQYDGRHQAERKAGLLAL